MAADAAISTNSDAISVSSVNIINNANGLGAAVANVDGISTGLQETMASLGSLSF